MSKNLLIIFVKNQIPGKVKTRLASTIGHPKALEIYQQLLVITENATQKVKADKQVYFSQEVIEQEWKGCLKFVQKGDNLGEKMQNAFKNGFSMHYDKIILIGSDLPDISSEIIEKGFDALGKNEVVLGPALDGGYYLIGMSNPHFFVFKNKKWSTEKLLQQTLVEIKEKNIKTALLPTFNDIDTFEDLRTSKVLKAF